MSQAQDTVMERSSTLDNKQPRQSNRKQGGNGKEKASPSKIKASSKKTACAPCAKARRACGSSRCIHGEVKFKCEDCMGLVHHECQHIPEQVAGGSRTRIPKLYSDMQQENNRLTEELKKTTLQLEKSTLENSDLLKKLREFRGAAGQSVSDSSSDDSDSSERSGSSEEESGSDIDSDCTYEDLRHALLHSIYKSANQKQEAADLKQRVDDLEREVANLENILYYSSASGGSDVDANEVDVAFHLAAESFMSCDGPDDVSPP